MLDKNLYKDFSGVDTAVNGVVRGKDVTEQAEVDAMAQAIEDAINALEYKDADNSKVDKTIAKANALKADDYKDFSAVKAAVDAVARGKNVTEQAEVDVMAQAIEDAINALEKKPGKTEPKTGDNSNIMLWIALLLISGGACTVLIRRRKRYDGTEEAK